MADHVCRKHQNGHEHTLVEDVITHTAGKEPGFGVPRALFHGVRLSELHAERQRGKAVGDQVDPEDMNRLEQRKAEQGGRENPQDLAEIGREKELDRLPDIGVDSPPFLDGRDDRRKIVVREDHIRHVLRHVGPGDAHADADVRGFDSRRIIDAVARHGGDFSAALPRLHDPDLVLRLHARVNAVFFDGLVQFLVGHAVQLPSQDRLRPVLQDPQLFRDGDRRIDMVAGNHDDADAGFPALLDGRLRLRPHGVDHAVHPEENHIVLKRFRPEIARFFRKVLISCGKHAQRPVRHRLVAPADLLSFLIRERGHAVLCQNMGAAFQDLVRRALGVLDITVSRRMDRGHHLPHGVERRFPDARVRLFQFVFIQRNPIGIIDQRALRGLPHRGPRIVVQLRIRAQTHGRAEFLRVVSIGILHRHPVLRQRAGFIRADDLRAAERFHRCQPADDGVLFRHLRHTDGKDDGDHGHEAFRNRGDGQAHGQHEGVQDDVHGKAARPEKPDGKDHDADAEDDPRQNLGQARKLFLQRRRLFLRLCERVRDLAHLRLHAGAADDGDAAPVNHRAPHIDHVFAVAQRDFLAVPGKGFRRLFHRHGFAGQRGLLHLHRRALDDPRVGGDGVPRLEVDDVAGHQLFASDHGQLPVAENLGGGGRHRLQRLNGLFGLVFLHDAEHGIQNDDRQDDEHVGERLPRVRRRDGGKHRRRQQHEDHRIGELLQEPGKQADLFPLRKLVFPIQPQPFFDFRRLKAGFSGFQRFQDIFSLLQIIVHNGATPLRKV